MFVLWFEKSLEIGKHRIEGNFPDISVLDDILLRSEGKVHYLQPGLQTCSSRAPPGHPRPDEPERIIVENERVSYVMGDGWG